MRNLYITGITLFLSANLYSQTATFQWTEQLSGASAEEKIWNFTYDSDGNIYGITDGYGSQTFQDTTVGSGYNTTIFKLNPAGDRQWLRCIPNSESGQIAIDASHNGYFGGWFDPPSTTFGPFTINAAAGTTGASSYYTTLNSSGNYSSAAKIFSGNYYLNSITKVICDGPGNVSYLDNRESLVGLSWVQYHTLTKKNADGTSWTKAFTVTDVNPMHIDGSNNLYIQGSYNATIVINGTTLTNSGETDSYIAKLNSGGTYQWIKKIGAEKSEFVSDITSDVDGNSYVTGYFNSTSLTIDGFTLIGDGLHHNTFIIKIDPAGTVLWAVSFGGASINFSANLYLDAPTSQLYVLGLYLGDLTIGPDVLINTPLRDFYIVKMDLNGTLLGGSDFAFPVAPIVYKYKLTSPQSVVIAGTFGGTTTIGDDILTASGTYDGFITYVSLCEEVLSYADSDGDGYGDPSITTTGCDVPAGYVLVAGDCNDANGTVHPGGIETCNSLDDDCDASVDENVITATITPGGPTTFCKGSNVILSANTGAGFIYQWKKNGSNIGGATASTYNVTKAGTYTVSITIPGGCNDLSDGVVVVVNSTPNATITNLDVTNDLCIDPSIKLKANSGVGFTWQWYKGASPLAGATSQIYSATTTGNYKVLVTSAAGCSKMSAAYTITHLCRESDAIKNDFNVYPNPNNGSFTISGTIENYNGDATVTILNAIGEELYSSTDVVSNGEYFITVNADGILPAGIYFIKIKAGNDEYVSKIVVE